MKIRELGHLAFRCKDLGKSLDFYCEILGFTKKFTMTYGDLADAMRRRAIDHGYAVPEDAIKKLEPLSEKIWFVYLQLKERQFLELFDAGSASNYNIPDDTMLNYQHMALIVENIEDTRAELEEKGIDIDVEVDYSVDGNIGMWIHDPDGNKIEIIQYTDQSLQFC